MIAKEDYGKNVPNQLKITGSNVYGTIGLGHEETQSFNDKVFTLDIFNYKKVHEIAVGDYHTLVLAGNDFESDLFAWGRNTHGQCDGIPNEKVPITYPKIVPYFVVNNIQLSRIGARKSRSVAITKDNGVYQWGHSS